MSLKSALLVGGFAAFGFNALASDVFYSGQQTLAGAEYVKGLGEHRLFLSNPPFNQAKTDAQKAVWGEMKAEAINIPCFGKTLGNAASRVQQAGVHVQYGIDGFVIGKLGKVRSLTLELQKRGLVDMADRINAYVGDLQDPQNKISTAEEWAAFLARHNLPDNMELDFNLYLNNFDHAKNLTPDLLTEINETKILDKDEKLVSLKDECVRWLTKVDFRPIGCFTDVANLSALLAKGIVPSHLFIDAENDDRGAHAILSKIHAENGTKLTVVVQLPTDARADFIAQHYEAQGVKVIRDPESRNIDALLKAWKK